MSAYSVLLIDDDCDTLLAIGEQCRRMGMHVRCAHDLLGALAMVETEVPDLLCIDIQCPSGSGLRFCQMLADNSETENMPIVVLTRQHDQDTVDACQRIGAHYVLKRPGVWDELRPLIERLLTGDHGLSPPQPPATEATATSPPSEVTQQPRSHRPTVAVVPSRTVVVADDDADMVRVLTERFTRLGCLVIGVSNAIEAINVIYRTLPDLVCIDIAMPAGNGLSVCEMMASDGLLRTIPAIVLTGKTDEETIARCRDLMVYYVPKDGDIWARVEPLARELLGVPERQAEIRRAEEEQTRRKEESASVPSSRRNVERAPDTVGSNAQNVPCDTGRGGAATNTVAAITPASLAAASSDQSGTFDESLLDAVFTMLGNCTEQKDDTTTWDKANDADGAERPSSEPPWVLCIDDDPDFSEALKCRLEACGVAVIRAYSGMEGYRLAFTRPASAILLDYNMPDGQGDYVLCRLQDNPVTHAIPVIVVTGVSDPTLRRRMLNMGAKGFFNKPIDFQLLRDALAEHIDILATPVS